ncbi:MAG TPA: histidine kinase [Smithella sp.]|nr:histidine kinase [Smithella sp.]HRS97195.1 histidine kinase [Smithella sp.]
MTETQYETEFILKYWSKFRNILADGIIIGSVNTLIAFVFTFISPLKDFLVTFIMVHSLGVTISLMLLLSLWVFRPRTWARFLLIAGIDIACGVLIGLGAGMILLQQVFAIGVDWNTNNLFGQAVIAGIIISSVMLYSFIAKIRLQYRNAMLEEEKIKRLALEKETLSANLRMLQAQIEPHFLFNTLSNIISLIDTKPDKGKSMLLDLTKYLRVSLSRTLPEKTTLSQEISMIKAYLDIQKIRMAERLHYQIDVPDHLWQHVFPPMLLQPLVENAVRHGLEPKVEGGEIIIRAARENNLLKIEVADTGLGFTDFDQPNVGIANVRKRLHLLFGEKGKLVMEENQPQGVRAIIEVPIDDV